MLQQEVVASADGRHRWPSTHKARIIEKAEVLGMR